MKTNFTRLRYILAALMCCLVSMGVWGQEVTIDFSQGLPSDWTKNGTVAKQTYANKSCTQLQTKATINSPSFSTAFSKMTIELTRSGKGTTFDINYILPNNGGTKLLKSFIQGNVTSNKFNFFNIDLPAEAQVPDVQFSFTSSTASYYIATIKFESPLAPGKEVANISFEQNVYNLTIDETANITATTNSDAKVVYSSNNENIAIVDNATGEVTALSSGVTTITASVSETESYTAAETSYTLNVSRIGEISICAFENFIGWPKSAYGDLKTFIIDNNNWSFTGIYRQADTQSFNQIKKESSNAEITTPTFPATISSIKTKFSIGGGSITIKNINDEILGISTNFTSNEPIIIDVERFKIRQIKICITADNTATAQMATLEIYSLPKPLYDRDINGTMTLTGPWAAADLSALDLTDPTITVINMVGITIPTDAPDLTPANPNCLIYVADGAAVPTTWKNVVAGGFASTISLQDGYNFYNAEEIITETVTYTRTFAKGWNTFSLPFDAEIPADDVIEEFDLQTESSIKFKTATGIYANQAYLIDIATDNTEKTFTATEVLVPVTASTGDIFKSNFIKQTGADVEGKYILVLEDDKEVFAPANDQATLAAFRGYIDLSATPNPAKKFTIEHDGGATNVDHAKAENSLRIYSENGALVIYSNEVQNVQIYAIDGRMIKNIQLSEGNNTINGLSKGIYLMNHQKAVVN